MKQILEQYSDPALSQKMMERVTTFAKKYKEKYNRPPVLMEVCGSHTMAFAKTGIKKRLQEQVQLIAGPGCPVCVTDQKSIDSMIELTEGENRIICTFGDMMRVPGSKENLLSYKTKGKDVRVVYSPLDAVKVAEKNPDKEVIFLGIGFETTVPILGAAIKQAVEKEVKNFTMWMTTKLVEPVLRTLLDSKNVKVDGFILPGHVSIVLGEEGYHYLVEDYSVPAVISGFQPVDLLSAISTMLEMLLAEEVKIMNGYKRIVTKKGNEHAQNMINTYFEPCNEAWRGIGVIKDSGFDLKDEYSRFNAKKKFYVKDIKVRKTKCRCGDVICGIISPEDCVLFGKACTPLNPIGPCMVSSEGSCAAHFNFMREEHENGTN